MAHAIETRTNNPATALRENLAEAERLIVNVNPDNVERLLALLDELDEQFETLALDQVDLRGEEGRWEGLQSRLVRRPAPIVAAGRKAGGWDGLRLRHAPAANFWWRLDQMLASRRLRFIARSLGAAIVIVILVALTIWGVDKLFPPDPDALLLMDANTQIDQRLRSQDWQGALDAVESARATLPDDPELLSWEVALAEQMGDSGRAQMALTRLQQVLAERPAEIWLSVGERRLAVGDLDGAEEAAHKAETLDPDNPQVYFLLANVAELRGDYAIALDLFDKTYTLAEQSDPQLAAIARIRMGNLMQRGPQQGPPPEPSQTP